MYLLGHQSVHIVHQSATALNHPLNHWEIVALAKIDRCQIGSSRLAARKAAHRSERLP